MRVVEFQGLLTVVLSAIGGWLATIGVQWLKSRDSRHQVDRTVDAQVEEQRDKLTFELLQQARQEVAEAKTEAAHLRPMVARLAHFEEALDHIHALLSSETDAEKAAAERRARAFLRRMRGDDTKGEMRNAVQTQISAERLIQDAEAEDPLDKLDRGVRGIASVFEEVAKKGKRE